MKYSGARGKLPLRDVRVNSKRFKIELSNEANASPEVYEIARRALLDHMRQFGEDYRDFYAYRYVFALTKINKWGDMTLTYEVRPRGAEIHTETDEFGPRVRYRFTGPKSVDHIVPDSALVYRGMSWEEWQRIRRRGVIESSGTYNIGQEGLTFFGDADTAEYYASSFAPLQFKPGKTRPGVIIAIPRSLALGPEDDSRIPGGEYATNYPIPIDEVLAVWHLIPTETKVSWFELIVDPRRGTVKEGSASRNTPRTAVIQVIV